MASPIASAVAFERSQREIEIQRIRELSKAGRHAEALAAAETICVAEPQNRDALYLLAANQRCLNRVPEALATLEQLEQHHPSYSLLYQERGHCYSTLRDAPRAIEAFMRAVTLNPALGASWAMLERLYHIAGNERDSAIAASQLANCIRLLLDDQKYAQALGASEILLAREPEEPAAASLHAAACAGLGRHQEAVAMYRRLLAASPLRAELHVLLGHSLKALGERDEAVAAYKEAAALRPNFGDAYWSLANLKSYHFSPDEIGQIRTAEAAAATAAVDRYHFCFALGKAYEDERDFAESWQFYERGNALKLAECRYRPEAFEADARDLVEVCTRGFFAARSGAGTGAPDSAPIFIVGVPRSGSTLLEQILASHSKVEATQELFEIPRIARELQGTGSNSQEARYPRALADLATEDFRALGEHYIRSTLPYRGGRPRFIDKMPNNFRHIGLIHLILPNARIIDMRREPMACCVSNLKQLFAAGQEFSYSVDHLARYFRTYLEIMRHWDEVLPGRVLRVSYEDLVGDLEGNVRRVLDFCGLDFEPACLEFHHTQRSIGTPSSEQVRRPLNREGLDQWRSFEPWLEPLKRSLGDALTRYRE